MKSGAEVHDCLSHQLSGWWFQPIWKICSSNFIISPGRAENKKALKPPPSCFASICPQSIHLTCLPLKVINFSPDSSLTSKNKATPKFRVFKILVPQSDWIICQSLFLGPDATKGISQISPESRFNKQTNKWDAADQWTWTWAIKMDGFDRVIILPTQTMHRCVIPENYHRFCIVWFPPNGKLIQWPLLYQKDCLLPCDLEDSFSSWSLSK